MHWDYKLNGKSEELCSTKFKLWHYSLLKSATFLLIELSMQSPIRSYIWLENMEVMCMRSVWFWNFFWKSTRYRKSYRLEALRSACSDGGSGLLWFTQCLCHTLRQLQLLLDRQDLAKVSHALITSWLDYCNVFWWSCILKTVQNLHVVENAAAARWLISAS